MEQSFDTEFNEPSTQVYSGNDANNLVLELAEKRASGFDIGEAVPTGIPFFDSENPPLMRGDVALITGLTSHGKSLFSATIAQNTLKRLGTRADAGLLVVMTEEAVEARRVQTWGDGRVTIRDILNGRAPMQVIRENILKTKDQPIYFVGQTAKLSDVGTRNGLIRPSTIADAIHTMIERGVSPELVIVDHAHDLEPDGNYRGEQEKCDSVAEGLKHLSVALRPYCPMIVLAQCNKDVEKRPPQSAQPSKYDLKYMQALGAHARDIYTVYYPATHAGLGQTFKTVQGSLMATQGMFLIQSAKVRYGACTGKTLAMTASDEQGRWSNHLQEMGKV